MSLFDGLQEAPTEAPSPVRADATRMNVFWHFGPRNDPTNDGTPKNFVHIKGASKTVQEAIKSVALPDCELQGEDLDGAWKWNWYNRKEKITIKSGDDLSRTIAWKQNCGIAGTPLAKCTGKGALIRYEYNMVKASLTMAVLEAALAEQYPNLNWVHQPTDFEHPSNKMTLYAVNGSDDIALSLHGPAMFAFETLLMHKYDTLEKKMVRARRFTNQPHYNPIPSSR